ncbi:MAG: patatin-like phospholipase family protein [Bacteroidales bacterium]|nr:patatin-like phospholipase family protein [Bacteroidales bacterium]
MTDRLLRIILIAMCLTCACTHSAAQRRGPAMGDRVRREEVKLAATSIDPYEDSLVFVKMRERTDSIRKADGRPVIALVLSGGGAKGAAHVGILKYLEEKRIPVDMILGTSIGGLVGGMYSLGYDADYLDSLFRVLDWEKMLSDRVDRDLVPYGNKLRDKRYIVSLPFHYSKEDFAAKVGDGVRYSARRRNLNLSAQQEDELIYGAAETTSFNSLPGGYAYGLNVSNLIAGKTVGYQDSLDFSRLPIPFFCVASDMVSCKAKYWTSGPLNTALRSTMSIPVLFEPVRYQDMILIDGGTRNNYPTDVARLMGADIIIGSVLSDSDLTYAQINNLADMVMQVIDMLGREAYVGNMRNTDIYIHPDVHEYNMLSFNKEAIDTMLRRGYEAAVSFEEQFDALKGKVGDAAPRLSAPAALDLGASCIKLGTIEFAGVDSDDAGTLLGECRLAEGDLVSNEEIEDAVARLFSLDALEAVSYTLHPEGDAYRLVFNCVKGPVHRIGASVRSDSEELVAALLNIGFNVNRLHGSRLDLEGRIGEHWYGQARYSYSAPRLPTFNLAFKGGYTRANVRRERNLYKAGFWRSGLDAYVSDMRLQNFDFRAGAKYDFFSLNSWLTDSGVAVPRSQMRLMHSNYGTIYTNVRHYTLDDDYYPSRGLNLGADLQWIAGPEGAKVMSLDFRTVIPITEKVAVIPSLWSRNVVDARSDNLYLQNFAGGAVAGRYTDSQMPFIGFNGSTPLRNCALVSNVDFRFNPAKNFYTSVQAGVICDNDGFFRKLKDLSPRYYGVALELAYNSFIGPLRARMQWSDFCGWTAYAGVGLDF